ncbi:MAG: serine/threonine-protein kinase [Kofleriaceae bacterium]
MSGIPAGAGSLLGKRLGKYEILALLALGGTAEIYLARIGGAAGFEKYVVVKCLHDHLADDTDFVKMFLDEARLAACLDHSNVVQTMELGEHENRYFMVMEFLAGLSLAMIVRRAAERLPGGKIPVPLVLNMLAQAAAGLHYAHDKTSNGKPLNIVHRDISPQNLVVSFEGVVKVVDFGIAKAEHRETRTRSGTIKGKFAYMSPEQCVANNVDRRTDVFALGVIAHELLTGRRLFKKPSPYETYQSVIECAVEPPSKLNRELDPEIDPIIMRAITKDKEQRYPTAEAFGDALMGYLHHRGKGSGPGDVARFFDSHFAQEIEEHGARMRELISGRDQAAVENGASWSDGDDKPAETVDIVRGTLNARIADAPPERGAMSQLLQDLGDGNREDDDDIPAERTRIEANPLQRVEELDKVVAKKTPPPVKIPSLIKRPQMPPSGALPLPDPPKLLSPLAPSLSPNVPSGRFPDLANLPTMVAADDVPELAETQLNSPPIVVDTVDALARTTMDMQSPSINGAPGMQGLPQQHPILPPIQPQIQTDLSYPVMDKEMHRQIHSGATVFPGVTKRETPTGAHDPQHAANVASPVGQHYGEQVDWDAAAAAPARAIPPWMLGLLFLAAIAVALGITIAIAKLVS